MERDQYGVHRNIHEDEFGRRHAIESEADDAYERSSNAGSLVAIVVAGLFAVAIFTGYTFFISENAPQSAAATSQQQTAPVTNTPNATPQNAPAATEQPETNAPRNGASPSQNAN
jgi:hypothetical protein